MATPAPSCLCGRCKICRNREAQRRYRERHPDRVKAAKDKWGKTRDRSGDPKVAEYNRLYNLRRPWRTGDPHRIQARQLLLNAVKRGEVVKQPCERCGSTVRIHGHHEDYDKPLDVVWLCSKHHADRHREIDAENQAI